VGSDDERSERLFQCWSASGGSWSAGWLQLQAGHDRAEDESGLELELFDHFGPDELEARHKLLFKLVASSEMSASLITA